MSFVSCDKESSFSMSQDAAMAKAIAKVFPSSRHRLCMWHITKKFPEKLSHVYHDHSEFQTEFSALIWNSKSIESFERNWVKVMEKYRLEDK